VITFEVAQVQGGKRTIVRADRFLQVDNTLQFYVGRACMALFHMDGGFSVMELGGDAKCPDCGYAPGERNSEVNKTYARPGVSKEC
jgi:hypothetical protein